MHDNYDPYAKLNASERRRRWGWAVRLTGLVALFVGFKLLPFPPTYTWTKRELSNFDKIADTGMFEWYGWTLMAVGLLAVAASFLISTDTDSE